MGDIRSTDKLTSSVLTNLAIQWGDPALIAGRVAPVVPVVDKSGKYPIYDDETLRLIADYRGEKDAARSVDFPLSSDTYYCDDHALRRFLADKTWQAAINDPGMRRALEQANRVKQLKALVLRNWEKAVSDIFTTSGNYLAALYENLDSVANRNFDDSSGPGGLAILLEFRDKVELACGFTPNKLILSSDTWQKMQADSNFFPSAAAVTVTLQQVAQLLQVEEVVVARSVYSGTAKGQAVSRSRIWGSNLAMFCIAPNGPSLEVPSTVYTFACNELPGASNGETVQTYRDPVPGGGGEWIEYSFNYGVKKTGVNASSEIVTGCLMENCYDSI